MTRAEAKIQAHAVFDRIWKTRRMSRVAAYRWLGDLLRLPEERAHIRFLSVSQCETLVWWSLQLLRTVPKPKRRRA